MSSNLITTSILLCRAGVINTPYKPYGAGGSIPHLGTNFSFSHCIWGDDRLLLKGNDRHRETKEVHRSLKIYTLL